METQAPATSQEYPPNACVPVLLGPCSAPTSLGTSRTFMFQTPTQVMPTTCTASLHGHTPASGAGCYPPTSPASVHCHASPVCHNRPTTSPGRMHGSSSPAPATTNSGVWRIGISPAVGPDWQPAVPPLSSVSREGLSGAAHPHPISHQDTLFDMPRVRKSDRLAKGWFAPLAQ